MSFLGTWSQEAPGGQETEVEAAGPQRGEVGWHHGRLALGPHPLGLWETGWNLAFSYAAQGCGSWVLTHQLLPARREGTGQLSTRIAGAGRCLDARRGDAWKQ